MKLLALGLVQLGLTLYFWVLFSVVGRHDSNSWKTVAIGALIASPATTVLGRFSQKRIDGVRGGIKSACRAVLIGYPAIGTASYLIAVLTLGWEGSYAGWALALWAPVYAIGLPVGLGLLSFRGKRARREKS